MFIPIHQPALVRVMSQGTECSFGPAIYGTIRFQQVNSAFKSLRRQLVKADGEGRILKWKIINRVARGMLPAANPEPAEIAVAVKNHQRLSWRRSHAEIGFHRRLIPRGRKSSKSQSRGRQRRIIWSSRLSSSGCCSTNHSEPGLSLFDRDRLFGLFVCILHEVG